MAAPATPTTGTANIHFSHWRRFGDGLLLADEGCFGVAFFFGSAAFAGALPFDGEALFAATVGVALAEALAFALADGFAFRLFFRLLILGKRAGY